jgi:hypothetical protein
MRYMMLIHHDDAAMGKADQKQLWADYTAFNDALEKAAGAETGIRLQPSSAATTVRASGDTTEVIDGPYADTKEQFAGYYFIEAADLDEAIAWAKRCPSHRFGSVEIRPVHDPKSGW